MLKSHHRFVPAQKHLYGGVLRAQVTENIRMIATTILHELAPMGFDITEDSVILCMQVSRTFSLQSGLRFPKKRS